MKKLSENYRNDTTEPLPLGIRKRIDEVYLATLNNLTERNPKVLVVYSGGNAVGKSTLSKRICDELKAVVIENDAIKRSIMRALPAIDRTSSLNPYTWKYSIELYQRLPAITHNGLIVRDGIIDWYYDRILPIFEKAGYRIFIVQFDQTKEEAIKAIKARGDLPTVKMETLLNQLDDHAIHQKRFRSEYSTDITLSGDRLYDHDAVLKKLKLLLTNANPGESSWDILTNLSQT